MADATGTRAKAFKKKKAFAFLKSAHKPTPTPETNGDHFDKDTGGDDDGLELFRRSRDFFPIVVLEQEHRHAAPEEKSRLSQESTQSPSPPSSKRRKLSSRERADDLGDSEEDLYGPPTPPRRLTESRIASLQEAITNQATPSLVSGKAKGEVQPQQSDILLTPTRSISNQPCANEVISLDDEDDDVAKVFPTGKQAVATTARSKTIEDASLLRGGEAPSPDAITIDDSDDDDFDSPADAVDGDDPFAHFVQRARQREAAAKAEAAAAAAASSRPDIQISAPEGAPIRRLEPVIGVSVYVYSRIEKFQDLGPFGAKRGMSQNLGPIRMAFVLWLKRQGCVVSEQDEVNIFLTWKRRKIYDGSTGVSLGWNPSAAGDSGSSATLGITRGGVLLEAWTQEDFDKWVAEEERQKMMKRGDLVEDVSDEEPVEADIPRAQVRITIKEKDQEPFNMKVDKEAQIRLLVHAIRRMRNIPSDREIRLRSEGEWLDGNVTVEDAEIEDECTVEMYLR